MCCCVTAPGLPVLALIFFLVSLSASAATPSIVGAVINGNQITITGSNLSPQAGAPKVYVGGIQLGVSQYSSTQVTANGVVNLGAGSYLLIVDNGSQGTFEVTNGAILLPYSGAAYTSSYPAVPGFSVFNTSIGSAATGVAGTGGFGRWNEPGAAGLSGAGGASGRFSSGTNRGLPNSAGGGVGVAGLGRQAAGWGDTAGPGGQFLGGSGGTSRNAYGGDGLDA